MENKAVIRQLFDRVLNKGDLNVLHELVSDDYIDHSLPANASPGPEGVITKVKALHKAFPDIRFILEDLVAEGVIVAARYHWNGTQTGTFLNIAPTGKMVDITGMDFYRIEEGKIIEHWHNIDELSLLHQLGVTDNTKA
ncbi:ester cyclase [Verrucomicrobiota bacterium]